LTLPCRQEYGQLQSAGNKEDIDWPEYAGLALKVPQEERWDLRVGGASEARGWKGMEYEPD